MLSRRMRSGHSNAVMMPPISASLSRPLTKFASACLENRRFKPASGEILESFGLSDSADHTSRCWIMLPPTAASASSSNGMATAAITSRPSLLDHAEEAAAVDANAHRNWRSRPRNVAASALAIAPGERHQDQRRAGDHEPGVDLLALDDVAALERLVEPFLGRVFRAFGVVAVRSAIAAHASRNAARAGAARSRPSRGRSPIIAPTDQQQDQEAEQDRQRQADEEHLHLRHQPRQHAEAEIEQQAEHQERRRQLDADPERGRRWCG